ncbi:hypothetical protein BDZ45DRAFT_716386 [Acephala macrosclerotiorum]|nr:hypothetical protein BDZ45DRAFT_716386 [Acephala macrosclerotiorum]
MLSIPSLPPAGRQIINANYQSYSIEFSYMLEYAGNISANKTPATPTHSQTGCFQNLKDISGAYPIIRAGGTTENHLSRRHTIYLRPEPPRWRAGLERVLPEAVPTMKELGNSLYAFEIGNESYVTQWLQYSAAIGNATRTHRAALFQAATFEAPRHLGNVSDWNAEPILRDGIAETGLVKTISEHDYMGSACSDATQIATLEGNLLNHTHMPSIAYFHDYLSNYTVSHGSQYVLGEMNSTPITNISDVFGAALWSIDYVLYMIGSITAHPKALYYGNLFTETAFASGNKQIEILVNETSFTAYVVYDAGKGERAKPRLTGLVLVNLNMWYSTIDGMMRPYMEVKLPMDLREGCVRRLTAPGADSSSNMTFASRSVWSDGNYVGEEVIERLEPLGSVSVGDSEALLISFDT